MPWQMMTNGDEKSQKEEGWFVERQICFLLVFHKAWIENSSDDRLLDLFKPQNGRCGQASHSNSCLLGCEAQRGCS